MPFPTTPSQTASNTPTPSITPSNTISNTPTGTVCPGLTPTATETQTATPTFTPTPTGTFVPTPSQTETPTETPTNTQTPTNTATPTATLPCGDFTLSPSFTFNFTNVSGTGLPSFTLPTSGSNETQCYYGTISAQTISVTLTGTSMMIPQLAVSISVNNVEQDYECITTTASTVYNLTLPSNVNQPDDIRISIISGKSGC